MKKIFFGLAALALLATTACNKDDKDDDKDLTTVDTLKTPVLEWGISKTSVKNLMEKYEGVELKEEEADELYYEGNGDVLAYDYEFTENSLEYSWMFVDMAKVDSDEIVDFLDGEAFSITEIDDDEGIVYWLSRNEKTAAALYASTVANTPCWVVLYTENTTSESTRADGSASIKGLFDSKRDKMQPNKERFNALKFEIEHHLAR